MSESPARHGGLHHSSVRRERTDVDTNAVLGFVAALAAGIAVVMVAMWGLFVLFSREEALQKRSTYPLAAEERRQTAVTDRLPPPPRLEGLGTDRPEQSTGRDSAGTARELTESQEALLHDYAWINEQHTAACIPIEEAIKQLGKPGALPARKDGQPVDPFLSEPSVTSSGRRPRGERP
jgi:hypothetical protein